MTCRIEGLSLANALENQCSSSPIRTRKRWRMARARSPKPQPRPLPFTLPTRKGTFFFFWPWADSQQTRLIISPIHPRGSIFFSPPLQPNQHCCHHPFRLGRGSTRSLVAETVTVARSILSKLQRRRQLDSRNPLVINSPFYFPCFIFFLPCNSSYYAFSLSAEQLLGFVLLSLLFTPLLCFFSFCFLALPPVHSPDLGQKLASCRLAAEPSSH